MRTVNIQDDTWLGSTPRTRGKGFLTMRYTYKMLEMLSLFLWGE